jgi:hypothetical protein
VARDDRIGFYLGGGRDLILAGNPDALSGPVEPKPVVMALQMVSDEFAHGEREMTVCAAVLKGDRFAVLSTEERDGLAKDYSS